MISHNVLDGLYTVKNNKEIQKRFQHSIRELTSLAELFEHDDRIIDDKNLTEWTVTFRQVVKDVQLLEEQTSMSFESLSKKGR